MDIDHIGCLSCLEVSNENQSNPDFLSSAGRGLSWFPWLLLGTILHLLVVV